MPMEEDLRMEMENECVRPQGGNSIMRFARNRGSQFAILKFSINLPLKFIAQCVRTWYNFEVIKK